MGTGTSTGVPVIGCSCNVCTSKKKEDNRLRSSILIYHNNCSMIIDLTPDFRQQALQNCIKKIDYAFITHDHADHIYGIDDTRQFSRNYSIPVYSDKQTGKSIKKRYDYIFKKTQKGGGKPQLTLRSIPKTGVYINTLKVTPVPVYHGKLKINGYKFGNNAYITDCSFMPDKSRKMLQNLDVLIINALREKEHPTHFSFAEAKEIIEEVKPKKAYITHLSHNMLHSDLLKVFTGNIKPAFDGLKIITA